MLNERTIAAVATPQGVGALSIVRLSGKQAVDIVRACSGGKLAPRRATLIHIKDEAGKVIDECIATWFAAPASFTGEDVVEICCHGGLLVTQLVLERLFACGACPAEPGEFSRRAFENGRLDLTQAEAVMDIIQAGSELALRAAQRQLQGSICKPVEAAIDDIVNATAHLEAYIDFPEEDIEPKTLNELIATLDSVCKSLERLLSTADRGRYLRDGIRTVIIGAPNAGKSSLLNCLAGYDRAIVSPTAGTTRDTVEESINLGGFQLRLVDTAGLHDTNDTVEQMGIERTMRAWEEADLVLEVVDASCAPMPLPEVAQEAPHILLLNKCDLAEHSAWHAVDALRISCSTQQGFDQLEDAIKERFIHRIGAQDDMVAINTRHRYALQQALDSLAEACAELRQNCALEIVSVDLRNALDALGSITGRVDTEDILTRVFSTFCLGK